MKNRIKENKSKGFVALYRSLLDWEYTDDDAVFSCFVKLLMAVNYQDKKWHGQAIKRGSIVGSIETLCMKLRIKKDTLRRCLKLLSECGAIKVEVVPNKYHIIAVTNYSLYQDKVDGKTDNVTVNITDYKTAKRTRKIAADTSDNKPDTTKQYNNINKETRCVCPQGTHTPKKEKTSARPPVTPLGGAPAGKRPQVNSAQHYLEQNSSPHKSNDINPTVISAGTRLQANDERETPEVTKDLTQRVWRVYCELKGHNEFEAADFWIKQRGRFDEIQKRKVREFLKANGERTETDS